MACIINLQRLLKRKSKTIRRYLRQFFASDVVDCILETYKLLAKAVKFLAESELRQDIYWKNQALFDQIELSINITFKKLKETCIDYDKLIKGIINLMLVLGPFTECWLWSPWFNDLNEIEIHQIRNEVNFIFYTCSLNWDPLVFDKDQYTHFNLYRLAFGA